ncbi:hypothetical protein [Geobacter argillaceus]|uniref:Uncharacterized protein n=1 Tax=Geobacter argillaceus TaxID=345631 RepID=A0A562VJ80_9BACT|nr:hypothetical protein [Geobacter argillaceus]TWJ18003.1 hypothetical protein JN12_02764 [Geobacter argillaceus]
MQNIPISQSQPGMTLAKDVVRPDNPNGSPLCGKGVELTAPLIMRLQNMGVQSIIVEGHPLWLEGDKTLEELLADLDHRFRRLDDHPRMQAIKDVYRDCIINSMEGSAQNVR